MTDDILIDMINIANDPFDPTQQIMNGSTVLTDGDWLWRKDFAYYVRGHRVAVSQDFLTLIRERDYVVPAGDVSELTACSAQADVLEQLTRDEWPYVSRDGG